MSSASTVEGLLSAIRGVPEMNARYASTLALGAIKRQDIAAYIALVTGTPPPPANYTGLWWASPAGSESGWGISFAHQGDVIFATWFTYDVDGTPMWLSGAAHASSGFGGPDWTGTLYRTTGPPFNSTPFDPAQVTETPVATFRLSHLSDDPASADLDVTSDVTSNGPPLDGDVHRVITREVFVRPGTWCR